jgi:hypothetical protein
MGRDRDPPGLQADEWPLLLTSKTLASKPRPVVLRRWLRVRPVTEGAPLTRNPVNPPAAPMQSRANATSTSRPRASSAAVGVHPSGRGHHRRVGVVVPGPGYQGPGAIRKWAGPGKRGGDSTLPRGQPTSMSAGRRAALTKAGGRTRSSHSLPSSAFPAAQSQGLRRWAETVAETGPEGGQGRSLSPPDSRCWTRSWSDSVATGLFTRCGLGH